MSKQNKQLPSGATEKMYANFPPSQFCFLSIRLLDMNGCGICWILTCDLITVPQPSLIKSQWRKTG